MSNEHLYLIRLMQAVLLGTEPDCSDLPPADWKAVFENAYDSKLHVLLYETVASLSCPPPGELLELWKAAAFQSMCRQAGSRLYSGKMLSALERAGLRPLVFKGPVLAALYPKADHRISSDIDILLPPSARAQAGNVLEENNFVFLPEHSKQNVDVWRMPGGFTVDMHFRMWGDYQDQRTEYLDSLNLTAEDTNIKLPLLDGQVHMPGCTQHLIYIIYHLVTHLTFQGIQLREFVDISLYVNRYVADIDVAALWRHIDNLGYKRFCVLFFNACVEIFGMTPQIMGAGFSGQPHTEPWEFMSSVCELCMNHRRDKTHRAASATVYRLYHGSGGRISQWSLMFDLLFPKAGMLSERYLYAKKNPVLLPVAWVERACRSIGSSKNRSDRKSADTQVIQSTEAASLGAGFAIAKKKLALIKELEL